MTAHISTFEQDWEIEDNNVEAEKNRRAKRCRFDLSERKPIASVKQIITQKYFYAGGSIRWMLTRTIQEIESDILSYLNEAENFNELLMFNLGPKSPVAKTHLYSSIRGARNVTFYKLISERATKLLVAKVGRSGIQTLYSHATEIKNPAFLGWVLEADYFSRCNANMLQLIRRDGSSFDVTCPRVPVEIDVGLLDVYASLDSKDELKAYLAKLIPDGDSVSVCKPVESRWL